MAFVRGMVASWLVRSTVDQVVGVQAWEGHCVVFLGTTLFSHNASLYPGVQMGTDEFDAGGKPAMD